MWTLLRRLIDSALVDDILGDLAEERERRARSSRVRAAVWYWRKAIALVVNIAFARLRESAPAAIRAVGNLASPNHVRHAFRSLRSAPWYSLTIVGVMTLSLALATTVFAVVDGVLFKPLPYPHAEELAFVDASTRGTDAPRIPARMSLTDVASWRDSVPAARFTAFRVSNSSRLEDVNDLPFGVAEVQSDFFDVLGVRPLLGGFQPEHFTDASNVGATILSYSLWQTRFGGAADIVGTRVTRGLATMLIVGVMPREFVFPDRINAQVLMPLVPTASERTNPRTRSFNVIARLPPDLSRAAAVDRIQAGMATVAKIFPPMPPPPPGVRLANVAVPFDRADLAPLGDRLAARSRAFFLAVLLAAGALVLLGCVNVSGLMAARGTDRTREMALRRALGAQTSDIGALIVAEAALLVGLGTIFGLALSAPLLTIVLRLLPTDLTLLKTPAIDWRVAAFASMAMVLAVAAVSIWPIRRGLRRAAPLIKGATRTATSSRPAGRGFVIAFQIAIGLVLTLGGALFGGSLVRLWQDDIGMTAEGVTAIELRIPAQVIDRDPAIVEQQTNRWLTAARAIPGVLHAGATDGALFRNVNYSDLGFRVPAGARSKPLINIHGVSDGFFDAVQLHLLAGRLPSAEELVSGRDVVVVSDSVARAYWPDAGAVGQPLQWSFGRKAFEVVGVVADARFNAWDDTKAVPIYAPMKALDRQTAPSLLIRTAQSEQGRALAEMMRLVGSSGPEVRAVRAATLDDLLADTVRPRRFQSWLFGSFAIAALTIVGTGILGLMGMTMARRVREFGVRIALGATRRSVIQLVLKEQALAISAGLLAGIVMSAWLAGFLGAYLYESTPYDPLAWAATVVVILGMAVVGSVIPAFRAGKIDPARALRAE